MSRGGRGGRGGGRGGFGGGRGGFNNSNPPPMGLTFADIQAINKEPSALYPPIESLPVLTEYTSIEKRIAELQTGFATRMRKSAYYVVEPTKSTELPRYADKYRPSTDKQPTLKRKDLHDAFFPKEILEDYFNPKKKKRKAAAAKGAGARANLDDIDDDDEEKDEEGSDQGSQVDDEDYDVDEEYDNDYAENYFDNGENDDFDNLDGGGGGDEGGGGGDYD